MIEADKHFNSNYTVSDGCWEWQGGRDKDGYGLFYAFGQTFKAHRYALERYMGIPLSDGCVCHKCDNPSCVNPEHLFWGTQLDNIKDRTLKKRTRNKNSHGELSHLHKVSNEVVELIRHSNEKGSILASLYDLSESQISRIRNFKSRA